MKGVVCFLSRSTKGVDFPQLYFLFVKDAKKKVCFAEQINANPRLILQCLLDLALAWISFPHSSADIDVRERRSEDGEVGSVFVYVWGGERGLKESLHPPAHPPHFFVLAQFFKTCLFFVCVDGQCLSLFLNKAGRLAEKKPVGTGRPHCVALTGRL